MLKVKNWKMCIFSLSGRLNATTLSSVRIAILLFVVGFWFANANANESSTKSAPVDESYYQEKLQNVVKSISEKFKVQVVVHLPERLQKTVVDPEFENDSTLDQDLKKLDELVGIRWAKLPNALALGPSAVPSFLELDQEMKKKLTAKNIYTIPEQQLIKSFSTEQVELLRESGSIPAATLDKEQLSIVKKLLSATPDTFDIFTKEGSIVCYLDSEVAWASVFVNGLLVNSVKDLVAFDRYSEEYSEAIKGPMIETLLRDVQNFITDDSNIMFDKPVIITFGDAVDLSMKGHQQAGRVIVSKLLRDKKLVVSSGQYSTKEFLALSLFAVRGEVRHIGDILQLAPENHGDLGTPFQIREWQIQQFVQSAQAWYDFAPIIDILSEKSPNALKLNGIPIMKLIPWTNLGPQERKYVLKTSGIEPQIFNWAPSSVEIAIGPVITCDLKLKGKDVAIQGGGFGLPENYKAIEFYTRGLIRMNNSQAVTPNLQ